MIRIDDKISKVLSYFTGNIETLPNEYWIDEDSLLLLTDTGEIDAQVLFDFYKAHQDTGDEFEVNGIEYQVIDARESMLSNKTLKIVFTVKLSNEE